MNTVSAVRDTLTLLREKAQVSQSELAKRLHSTPSVSRISRIESGDIELTFDEALRWAEAIGTSESLDFATYLREEWKILPKPRFDHVSRQYLRNAESALQRLTDLENDPELKNAFVQQIKSCKEALERAARYVASTEHTVAFVGSPGVGKTTAICTLAGLRDSSEKDLNHQMKLQTGSGRTTICEFQVRSGDGYGIVVDPCSIDELRQHVSDFCDHFLSLTQSNLNDLTQGSGISAEMLRALRNMSGLKESRTKDTEGKTLHEDLARDLAAAYPRKEDLLVQVMSRLDLPRRNRTSVSYTRDDTIDGLEWIYRTTAEINYGKHPEFSLPQRVEVMVPGRILPSSNFDVRFIDTRGVDEPAAPRRDLQAYIDDDRVLVVLCSGFKDAPDAAVQAITQRASEGGLRDQFLRRGLLLVLPQSGEEGSVRDNGSGEIVATPHEGREIRGDQVDVTLSNLGFRHLPTEFLNVRDDHDCSRVRASLVDRITQLRSTYEDQIQLLTTTVEDLIANKSSAEVQAVFEQALRPMRVWFSNNLELPELGRDDQDIERALLEEMAGLRYAASLRASVNRRGSWPNFDYWHGLGFGTRRETVKRTTEQMTVLKGLVKVALDDPELDKAHGFLRHLQNEIETTATEFYQEAQSIGESTFLEQLRNDDSYWGKCRSRWGQGAGYKNDIRQWTGDWFGNDARAERHKFIDREIRDRWKNMMTRLNLQLNTTRGNESEAVD